MSDHLSSNERVDPRCGCTRSRDPIIGTLHRPDCWADNMVAAQREIDRLRAALVALMRAVKHMPEEHVTPELEVTVKHGREALTGVTDETTGEQK